MNHSTMPSSNESADGQTKSDNTSYPLSSSSIEASKAALPLALEPTTSSSSTGDSSSSTTGDSGQPVPTQLQPSGTSDLQSTAATGQTSSSPMVINVAKTASTPATSASTSLAKTASTKTSGPSSSKITNSK